MTSEHPLNHRFLRMVVVSLCWLVFAVVGFWVYATYIHDVGATYWVMQMFLLPVALPFVLLFDFLVLRHHALTQRFGLVAVLDSGFAILLWLWPLWALGLLVAVACLRLLPAAPSLRAPKNPMGKS
ncbi:MAG: hypothetical protein WA049_01080 [Ferribacterium limneticum]